MRSLTPEEWKVWINGNGYRYDGALRLGGPAQLILDRAPVPDVPGELPAFVHDLVEMPGVDGQRMVWISEWRIWSATEYGLHHLQALTGLPIRSEDEPNYHCYVFEQSEWKDVMPLLCVPLLYGWDAYLLVEGGDTLTKISHESNVTFSLLESSRVDPTRLLRWGDPG